jgi:hypothetical protein
MGVECGKAGGKAGSRQRLHQSQYRDATDNYKKRVAPCSPISAPYHQDRLVRAEPGARVHMRKWLWGAQGDERDFPNRRTHIWQKLLHPHGALVTHPTSLPIGHTWTCL